MQCELHLNANKQKMKQTQKRPTFCPPSTTLGHIWKGE
jgi:tryptophan-rich sensory protein